MKAEFWLKIGAKKFGSGTFGRWGIDGVPKASKSKPDTSGNEIAVKMTVDLSDSLFEEPQLEVTLTVPEPKTKPVITSEVKREVAEALASRLGVKVSLHADRALTGEPKAKAKGFVAALEEI